MTDWGSLGQFQLAVRVVVSLDKELVKVSLKMNKIS